AAEKQTANQRVAKTGIEMEAADRTPDNVAIDLDRTGTMTGEKIAQARDAAIAAIERLRADDIVSVVTYDDIVNVIVPATKVSDRETIYAAIRQIQPGNSTALFAGVSKGAAEIRKFLDSRRVNRVILLSDGIANVGLSSPDDLGELGASLRREGISVTTVGHGLDYNEDLMVKLASRSDGNHAFVENAVDLARIFNAEFGDVLSVCAQDVRVRIQCAPGIRPIRVLGRDAEIAGQDVYVSLNQLYGGQLKYVMLEVEVPGGSVGQSLNVASVDVTYANMKSASRDELHRALAVTLTNSPDAVEQSVNKDVMIAAVREIGSETSRRAIELRDQGKIEEARSAIVGNRSFYLNNAQTLQSEELLKDSEEAAEDLSNLDNANWGMQRKVMKEKTNAVSKQQMYKGKQ
ncbi:MAG: Ca-activated chloride channel, partial [Candidatus Hydrogenedentes bacterium]|nr:Ca-activated chloride channel [Candidatus Hydrogenedentota bacterium]